MRLKNRSEAGKELASLLKKYKDDPLAIVIGLPRGGVITAFAVAKSLNVPLDIVCPRKIGSPQNPEFAIGAITETGKGIFYEDVIKQLSIPKDYIEKKTADEKARAEYCLKLYRKDRSSRDVEGKTVILVDDGLATGATMRAAIASIKAEKANKIVVAIPVAPSHAMSKFEESVDEVFCLMTPPGFYAVGQFYTDFAPVQDEQVIACLQNL